MYIYICVYAIPPVNIIVPSFCHHCAIIAKDKALAVLGSHTFSDLPPGFETRASQSKPGQLVYLDLNLGDDWKVLAVGGRWRWGFCIYVYIF